MNMRWKKLGKIFDPTIHPFFKDYVGFAQSPQVLVLRDRVRVYFSIRKEDKNGKFLSHISFVDFNTDLTSIINVADHQVIELGALGSFDEHGIFPINPVEYKNEIYAYTCGWSRRVSVSVETSIGLAMSKDGGLTFQKIGDGPIFSSALHEPFLVGDSFVRVFNDVFHMWYIYGTKWSKFSNESSPDRVYKIAYAKSHDGITWQRDGKQIVADKLNEDECQALPTVTYFDSRYHMYFCYRHATGFRKNRERSYRIGYAFSDDLLNWNRNDEEVGIDVTPGDWDSDMLCYPHVFQYENKIYLLYNGNEFGKYGFGLAIMER
jgi:sucrose-6-phosphate hydrolase SacC (GH32 family)